MRSIGFILAVILQSCVSICFCQTPITSGYATIVSDADYQTSPQISANISLTGNDFHTRGTSFSDGSAQVFLSNRQISGFSYIVQPNVSSRGWIQIAGLVCPNGYYSNPNSNESTKINFSIADFYIPKFYSGRRSVTVIVPFTMTGRVSCFGNNSDNNPPTGTKLITGTGNARLIFTRNQNSISGNPNRRRLYLLTAQYEFINAAAKE